MKSRHWFLLLLLVCGVVVSSPLHAEPTTLAVMPFAVREGANQAWLAKGLGDLMARALAQAPGVTVVERDRLQSFIDEMELGEAPQFDKSTALRVGRMAQVDQVVYGSYQIKGPRVSVSAFILDLAKQRVVAQDEKSGEFKDLPKLTNALALQLIRKRGQPISDADRERILHPVTDSISAAEHFYRGLDAYDHGQYPDALGEFVSATQQDPVYLDARLWTGRLFEAQGYHDHAVLAYRELFQKYPRETEALDALLLAGRILQEELAQPDRALVQLRTILQIDPASPHALEAAYRMGLISENRKAWPEAYQQFRFIEKFVVRVSEKPEGLESSDRRRSRFFTWPRAFGLYADAMVHAITAYDALLQAGQTPEPPRGVLPMTVAKPAFAEERFRTTPSLFVKPQAQSSWKEEFYAVVAPAGTEMTGIELSVTGQLHEVNTNRDYTLRVMPFPMPRQFFNRWLGTIYGQTKQMTTLQKRVSFHGRPRRVVMLQLIENGSEIKGWGIRLGLRPVVPFKSMKATIDRGLSPRKEPFFEGQPLLRIPIETRGFGGATRPSIQSFYGPERRLALTSVPGGGHLVVMSQGDLDGEATDLFSAASNRDAIGGTAWQLLPINSAAEDYDPRLVPSENGRLRLAWLSNRRGRGWEIWWSERDRNDWSPPRRIPIEKTADAGMEALSGRPSVLLEYDLMQDRRGRWHLAYYARPSQAIVIMRSRDFQTWEVVGRLLASEQFGLSLAQDSSERFFLSSLAADGTLTLRESIDGKNWTATVWPSYRSPTPQVSRTQLLPYKGSQMAVLVSDKVTGLQFAIWQPGKALPLMDLVSRVDIQNFAPARMPNGRTWVALENSEAVEVRAYEAFNASGKNADKDTPNWAIYVESEKDAEGNTWKRYIARERFRIPDVTALAIEPNGRIWWGIETGIMSLYRNEFFATDVSQGFITNDIRRIFALPDQPGVIDVEAGDGRVWRGNPQRGWQRSPRKPGSDPTYGRRATDPKTGGVWSIPDDDTPSQGLDYFDGRTHRRFNPAHDILDAPSSLAIDKDGNVWVGTWFKGLYKLEVKR